MVPARISLLATRRALWIGFVVSSFVGACSPTGVHAGRMHDSPRSLWNCQGELGCWQRYLEGRPPYFGEYHQGGPEALRWGRGSRASGQEGGDHPGVIAGVIRDDFLVNDDTLGWCSKYSYRTAMDTAGNFVVVWEDYRDGSPGIYAQCYDGSGLPEGSNFRVNDNVNPRYQFDPAVAVDPVGNFVIVWEDWRDEAFEIYGQLYDSSGSPQGSNFRIDDLWPACWWSSVAMDTAGRFVVTWTYDGGEDIRARMFDASGSPLGPSFQVNDDSVSGYRRHSSVAMDWAGDFVIAWDADTGYNAHIIGQRFDASGSAKGTNFRVNTEESNLQIYPSVAMDAGGDFVIAWEDWRGDNDIYLQLYDSAGIPAGSNIKVNDDLVAAPQANVSVSMDFTGGCVVAWEDGRNGSGDEDIYAQRYDSSGVAQGVNFKVNDDPGPAEQVFPSVAMDMSGDFAVIWGDEREYPLDQAQIYCQRYDELGAPQGPNFKVNDDEGTAYQAWPSAAMAPSGAFVVAWSDWRNGPCDVYAQLYDQTGTPQGPNFRVNDDDVLNCNYTASVAMDGEGDFVVVWEDYRNVNNSDIFAQLYSSSGIPQGSNFQVNDPEDTTDQCFPSVAMDWGGRFAVVWTDESGWLDSDIFGRLFDANGSPEGAVFQVNDNAEVSFQTLPSVSMSDAGHFVVAWDDERNGSEDEDVYAQLFDSSGTALGVNFRANDDVGTNGQGWPSTAMGRFGDFVIVWPDNRNGSGNADIYGQRYDASGAPQGPNFAVNEDPGLSRHTDPSVAIDREGNRFAVMWTDRRNADGDPEVFAQKFEGGIAVGPNVQINNPDSFPYNPQWTRPFCLACNNDMLCFTWQDSRRHKSDDIYAKLTDWNLLGVEERDARVVSEVRLRGFPNPFRHCIEIRGSQRELDVYDLSGRFIARTVKGIWNGMDRDGLEVRSGVYFMRSADHKPLKVVKLQ